MFVCWIQSADNPLGVVKGYLRKVHAAEKYSLYLEMMPFWAWQMSEQNLRANIGWA